HDTTHQETWTYAFRAEQAISRFCLEADTKVGVLSGGQKKRLALARAMALAPDALLLDEPTNHLDIAAIEWLEEFLLGSGVPLLFITHDRRFLDRLATRIVELDRGKLTSFPGSFSTYQQRRMAQLADEFRENARFDKLLKAEETWIRQGVEARRTRAVFRVQRLDQLRAERTARRDRLDSVKLQIDTGGKSGQMVAELHHVNKTFGTAPAPIVPIVRDFSCRILRGDRIGVIGPNGAGKTTLLRLILGELQPDSGTIRRGTKLEVAYFDQFRVQLDPEAMLSDVISPGSDYVDIAGVKKHVVGYLGDFLFAPQRARSPVKSLSGGERNRLLLARLFARPANVLVLDEPTNDLDIETLELLESLLQDYEGTVFLVSHDRAFLDAIVTQTIASEGDGCWHEYAGGYDDWARTRRQPVSSTSSATSSTATSPAPSPKQPTTSTSPTTVKLSWKEQRELDSLPEAIEVLENEQRHLTLRLEDPATHRNPLETQAIACRLAAIEQELHQLMERWELLECRQKR
ncbi:MAG: ATP-binding cassette domain-containing protein, partial [Rhodocyclaceae bacterium]|nr:ATP-binding cassette domain-containing protein [Rhodocyclaceae bacterium]